MCYDEVEGHGGQLGSRRKDRAIRTTIQFQPGREIASLKLAHHLIAGGAAPLEVLVGAAGRRNEVVKRRSGHSRHGRLFRRKRAGRAGRRPRAGQRVRPPGTPRVDSARAQPRPIRQRCTPAVRHDVAPRRVDRGGRSSELISRSVGWLGRICRNAGVGVEDWARR